MKINVYTNVTRSFRLLRQGIDRLAGEAPGTEAAVWMASGNTAWSAEWSERMKSADVDIFLWMGTGLDCPFLQKAVAVLRRTGLRYLILVENAGDDKVSEGFSKDQIRTAWQYFRYDGAENMYNLLLWLGSEFGGAPYPASPPRLLPWHGVWHPEWTEEPENIEGYLSSRFREERPTVGIIFYRTDWITGDFTWHAALANAVEAAGMNVIPVFTNSFSNESLDSPTLMDAVNRYFYKDGRRLVDVVINTMKFSWKHAGTRISSLAGLGVPILEAYTVLSDVAAWESSPSGLDPMEVSISVSLPEFDGVIHSVPIAAKTKSEIGAQTFSSLPERMERLAAKAKKWAALARKPNSEKKIAIVFHNYPPKNSNIGSAAGLDSPESVRRLLIKMREAGYVVDFVPEDSKSFMAVLTGNATNDRDFMDEERIRKAPGRLAAGDYGKFFRRLSDAAKARLIADWGEPPGEVFNYDDELLVPGTMDGNIFITVQPPRGFGEDPGKILHSPDLAPTHHYIGFYHWIRDLWRADAVIHVGTHGSLEWLPGKSAALSASCWPDVSLGDLPDVYPYWITIVGEGIQAKRRGAACLISHLSPPMELAGSFGEIEELEKALDEYSHFRATQPENLDAIKAVVREKAEACHFEDESRPDCAGAEEDFDEYAGRLHTFVTDLKNIQIRTGLHILGQPPEGRELTEFIMTLSRLDNEGRPSLLRLLAAEAGYEYDALLEKSGEPAPDGIPLGKKLDGLETRMRRIISALAERDFSTEAVEQALALEEIKDFSPEGRETLKKCLDAICETVAPAIGRTKDELTNTLRALDGCYIEPSPGGAPSTNYSIPQERSSCLTGDELLPTGRNFFGVDPRALPTQAAWELGKSLGDEAIARFIGDEGRYPEAVGIVFWAGANIRSHGQCIAEYMYLMGVRPVWQRPAMRVCALEAIPLSELKRPRIDATARISGLFRDSMPNAIKWLDAAAQLVRDLDETDEENFVRKHVKSDAAWLEKQGVSHADAWRRASYRIFGNPPGAYGAGVAALLESSAWDNLSDIAEVYSRYSGTAYGSDALPGDYEPEVFKRRMSGLDITIKNEDNRETNMFSADDFNAYHGGMIATVRALTGKAPHSYSGDSSDRRRVQVRTVAEEAKRVFRAEAMNPKFIEGMKRHGYKGAAELANMIAHSYQWDATSKVMEDWMYEKYAERYALDTETRNWIADANPWALYRMAKILLEAEMRGLWNAKPETKDALTRLYLDIEGEIEERAESR